MLTSGTSTARRVRPERRLKGRGAHSSAMPAAVMSLDSGASASSGSTSAARPLALQPKMLFKRYRRETSLLVRLAEARG